MAIERVYPKRGEIDYELLKLRYNRDDNIPPLKNYDYYAKLDEEFTQKDAKNNLGIKTDRIAWQIRKYTGTEINNVKRILLETLKNVKNLGQDNILLAVPRNDERRGAVVYAYVKKQDNEANRFIMSFHPNSDALANAIANFYEKISNQKDVIKLSLYEKNLPKKKREGITDLLIKNREQSEKIEEFKRDISRLNDEVKQKQNTIEGRDEDAKRDWKKWQEEKRILEEHKETLINGINAARQKLKKPITGGLNITAKKALTPLERALEKVSKK